MALTNATYSSGGGNFWWTDDVVGSGTYAGGGFTVDLAATVDAQYLEPFDADDFDEGVAVSDPNAMTGGVDYLVAYKSDDQVGEFRYCNYASTGEDPITRIEATFVYTDRDVTVTGFGSGDDYRYTYNVSLKKGWNIIYGTWVYNEAAGFFTATTTTGTAPAGMKWYYISGGDYSSYSTKADSRRAAGRKAFFGKLKTAE